MGIPGNGLPFPHSLGIPRELVGEGKVLVTPPFSQLLPRTKTTKHGFVVLAPCCRRPQLGFIDIGGDVACVVGPDIVVDRLNKYQKIVSEMEKNDLRKKKHTSGLRDVSVDVSWAFHLLVIMW